MKIISISAHPDDMELNCAGTLKKFQEQGAEIISVLTVKPSGEDNPNRNSQIVTDEFSSSYSLSKFECRIFRTPLHASGRPNLMCNNNSIAALSKLIDSCDLAIIPNPLDSHQDHRNTYDIAWPIVLKKAKEVWVTESFPYCRVYDGPRPNIFVDITSQFDFKMSLVKCYNSYFSDEHCNQLRIANEWWGQSTKGKYAEAFTLRNRQL
jgi:LmbE family N-acetylglucosaminyl deacetylase